MKNSLLLFLFLLCFGNILAQDSLSLSFNSDFVSKYMCRSLNIGNIDGNKKNPTYYRSNTIAVINEEFKLVKTVEVSDKLSIPVSLSVILIPNKEITYMVLGISI